MLTDALSLMVNKPLRKNFKTKCNYKIGYNLRLQTHSIK